MSEFDKIIKSLKKGGSIHIKPENNGGELNKDYIKEARELANKVDKVEGSSLIPNTKLTLIDTNASDIDALEVRVAANEAKLVGITTTVVSTINTAIDAAMAWHEVTE